MGIETLAIAGLGMSVAKGVVGAMGASEQADAQAASDRYKAQVAANNAIIANRNAVEASETGAFKGQVQDLKTKNMVSTQLVTQAASGIDVGSGTAVNVRQSALDIGHLDTMTILHNAAKNAAGYRAQAMNFTAESGLDTQAASNAEKAGDINVASSLLGGASSFSDKWMSYSNKGIF